MATNSYDNNRRNRYPGRPDRPSYGHDAPRSDYGRSASRDRQNDRRYPERDCPEPRRASAPARDERLGRNDSLRSREDYRDYSDRPNRSDRRYGEPRREERNRQQDSRRRRGSYADRLGDNYTPTPPPMDYALRNRRGYCKPNPEIEEEYRREAREAALARRHGSSSRRGNPDRRNREQERQEPKGFIDSVLHDGIGLVRDNTADARGRLKGRYDQIDQNLGGIIPTKFIIAALGALFAIALLSLGVRFAAGLVKSADMVDNIASQTISRVDSCKLSEKKVASRLEAVGVEDTWADKAATLSQTDARFQIMAQLSDSLGREGKEVTNKMVKLAVNDPEAVDYVVGFITEYPQKSAESYNEKVTKGTVPMLYQWDTRWAYLEYSGTTFGCTGCGPTTLSMTYMGVTGNNDMSPGDMAKLANKDGFETPNEGTMNQFFTEEAQGLGMTVDVLDVETKALTSALKDGKVVICNVGPGDFTDYGHFIVITGLTEDGDLKVNDPFSSVNSAKTWDPDKVINQTIALYAYSEL